MSGNLVIKPFLQSALVPSIAALAGGALVYLVLRAMGRSREVTGLLTSVSLIAGYLAGDIAVRGMPRTPPTEASQWLPWFGATCLLATSISSLRSNHRWPAYLFALLIIPASAFLTLRPLLQYSWKGSQVLANMGVIIAILLFNFVILVFVASRTSRLAMHIILLMQLLAASLLLGATGSALLAQLTGSLVAGAAVSWLLAWRIPSSQVGISASMAVATLLGSLLLNGHFYSETPRWSALAVLLAPIGGLVIRCPPLRGWKPASQSALAVITVTLVLALAIGFTMAGAPTTEPYRP